MTTTLFDRMELLRKHVGRLPHKSVYSVEEWRVIFATIGNVKEQMLLILMHLDGHGVEYGFDYDDDAENLANAIEALKPQQFP